MKQNFNIFGTGGYMPDNFFNIFNSDSRNDVANLLLDFYKYSIEQSSYSYTRDEFINLVKKYYDFTCSIYHDDEENMIYRESQECANIIFSKFKKYGWVVVDENSRWEKEVDFSQPAIDYMKMLSKKFNNMEESFVETLRQIYETLNAIIFRDFETKGMLKDSNYSDLFFSLVKGDEQFIESLTEMTISLKYKIRQATALQNFDDVQRLLSQFQQNIIQNKIHELKTVNKPYRYKTNILEKLEIIFEDTRIDGSYFELIIEDIVNKKGFSYLDSQTFVYENFNKIRLHFTKIDEIISKIDREIDMYVQDLNSKLSYFSKKSNLVGKINEILLHLDEIEYNKLSKLDSKIEIELFDRENTYKPNKKRTPIISQKLSKHELTKEDEMEIEKNMQKKKMFSKKNIEKIIVSKIEGYGVFDSLSLDLNEQNNRFIFAKICLLSDKFDYLTTDIELNNFVRNGNYKTTKMEMRYKK